MNEKPQDFLLHFWVASWQISPIIPQTKTGSCSASFTITKSITFGKFTGALKLQLSWWWSMSLSSSRLTLVLYFPSTKCCLWILFPPPVVRSFSLLSTLFHSVPFSFLYNLTFHALVICPPGSSINWSVYSCLALCIFIYRKMKSWLNWNKFWKSA